MSDAGYSIHQTNDGGFIITGSTSFGAGNHDVSLIKLDSVGTFQWVKTFGGLGEDRGLFIQQSNDDGFIITGYTDSFGAGNDDIYLIKTTSDGNLQWTKTFGGIGDDNGNSVQQTIDGGFIISATTNSFGAGVRDFYLVKTDSDGTMQWTKTFGSTNNDFVGSLQQSNDGGYIISGYSSSFGAGNYDIYLVKTDSNGSLQWAKTFGGTNDDQGYSIKQSYDGGFIVIGKTNSFGTGGYDIYLLKTTSNGSLQWEKTFGGIGFDVGYSIQQVGDSGFVMAGYTGSFGAGAYDVYLVKISSDGNLQWSKTFGGANGEQGASVLQSADKGYIITGFTFSFGPGAYNSYLIKTDSNGNTGCNEISPNTIATIPTTIITNPATQVSSGGVAGTPATQTGNGGTETILCFLGVNDFQTEKPEITIFPNPFSTRATFQITNYDLRNTNCQFEMHDVYGRVVKQLVIPNSSFVIERSGLPSGIYFYKLSTSTQVLGTGKVVAE